MKVSEPKKRSKRSLSGFGLILLIYIILGLIALSFYPKGFSPLTNTLSQLGNPNLNPSGAIFYNVGIVVVSSPIFLAAILLLFFGEAWKASFDIKRKLVFYLIVAFMVLLAFFNILTAIIPAGTNDEANSFFTLVFFIFFELFLVSSAAGIRNLKNRIDWIPKLGFFVATANFLLVMASIATGLPIVSWAIAIMSWSYMLAFVYQFS